MDVVILMTVFYICGLLFCFYLKLEWIHPAVVHALVWLFCSCLVLFLAEEEYLPDHYYILFANFMFFVFALLGGKTLVPKIIDNTLSIGSNIFLNGLPFIIIFFFYVIVFSNFSLDVFLNISAFRDYLVADDGANYGSLGRLALLSLFSSSFLLLRNKKLFFLSGIMCRPMIYILGAKTLNLLYLVTILVLTPKRLRLSKVVFFSILFILTFFGIMSIRFPDASFNLIFYYLFNYVSGGFLGFSQLTDTHPHTFGFYSFRNIYLWLSVFYPFSVANIIQEWVTVPFPVNVYTYLRPYYLDFGYVSIVFPAVFGLISGRIYVQKYKSIRRYYIFYPIVLYAILMQLFDDQYLTWLSNWLILVIVGYFMTWGKRNA